LNEITFRTGGDWDSTTLFNNGVEVPAAQLFVELRAGRDDWGNPTDGGIFEGADLTAIIRPAEDPMNPFDILPGRLTMDFPGYQIVLENFHPGVYLEQTHIFMNGDNITDRVVDLYVDINAADDVVAAWVSVYRNRFLFRDEVVTHTIIG
jgi:hypothetical protein